MHFSLRWQMIPQWAQVGTSFLKFLELAWTTHAIGVSVGVTLDVTSLYFSSWVIIDKFTFIDGMGCMIKI